MSILAYMFSWRNQKKDNGTFLLKKVHHLELFMSSLNWELDQGEQ